MRRRTFNLADLQFVGALIIIACGVALMMILAVALLYLLILWAASGAAR